MQNEQLCRIHYTVVMSHKLAPLFLRQFQQLEASSSSSNKADEPGEFYSTAKPACECNLASHFLCLCANTNVSKQARKEPNACYVLLPIRRLIIIIIVD